LHAAAEERLNLDSASGAALNEARGALERFDAERIAQAGFCHSFSSYPASLTYRQP
jgi:hypothetical protein